MNYDELHQMIRTSTASDWVSLDAGPYFAEATIVAEGQGKKWVDEVRHHHSRAVLRADLDVSLSWGMEDSMPYYEEWVDRMGGPHVKARRILLDFFYRGAIVDRSLGLAVDGTLMPFPRTADEDAAFEAYFASSDVALWDLVNTIESSVYPLDRAIRLSGLPVR